MNNKAKEEALSISKKYSNTTNLKGATVLFLDWLAIFIIISASVYVNNIFFYIASVWCIGAFQFAISEVLLHEASHNHLFKTKKLNKILSIFYADPFFINFDEYKKTHMDHHKYLGDPEYDHIAEDYEEFGLMDESPNLFYIWFIKPITGFCGYSIFRYEVIPNICKNPGRTIAFWLPIFAVCWYFDALSLLVLYWFIPMFWASSSILYWSEVGDHYNTKSETRSNLSPVLNFFQHNIGFHSLHHEYPNIPWHNLPEAYNEMKEVDKSLAIDESYGFIDTYKQMCAGK